jgi:hypothetical protein
VEAPLAIRGTVGPLKIDTTLGDGQPLSKTFRIRVAGAPPIHLVARTVPPRASLHGARDPRGMLARAEDGFLRAARARQYDTFLANPGPPNGSSTAEYVYVTAARAAPAIAHHGGGTSAWATALIAAAAVLAAGGAVVAWAHA